MKHAALDWIRMAYARCGRGRLILSRLFFLIFLFRVFAGPEFPLLALFWFFLSSTLQPKDPKPVSDKQRLAGAIVLLFVVPATAFLLRDMEATQRFFHSTPGCLTLLGLWILAALFDIPFYRRLPPFRATSPVLLT